MSAVWHAAAMKPLRRVAAALSLLLVAMLVGVAPAHAAFDRVDDPAGDADAPGLDITGAVLRNRDDEVVVRVRFVEVVRGDLVVSVDPRGKRGVRLISERRGDGSHRDHVLPGAFSDRSGGDDAAGVDCPGYRVRWSETRSTATLRLPSTCLRGGDYGAVRFAVLTERGADADFAPDNRRMVTGWTARG